MRQWTIVINNYSCIIYIYIIADQCVEFIGTIRSSSVANYIYRLPALKKEVLWVVLAWTLVASRPRPCWISLTIMKWPSIGSLLTVSLVS